MTVIYENLLTIKSFVDLYLRAAFLCYTHHTSTYGRMVDGHIYFIYNRVIMAIISLLFFICVTAAVWNDPAVFTSH